MPRKKEMAEVGGYENDQQIIEYDGNIVQAEPDEDYTNMEWDWSAIQVKPDEDDGPRICLRVQQYNLILRLIIGDVAAGGLEYPIYSNRFQQKKPIISGPSYQKLHTAVLHDLNFGFYSQDQCILQQTRNQEYQQNIIELLNNIALERADSECTSVIAYIQDEIPKIDLTDEGNCNEIKFDIPGISSMDLIKIVGDTFSIVDNN